MANDQALMQLAELLKRTQGQRVAQNTPGVTVKATAPPLPAFQMPGNMLPPMSDYMRRQQPPVPPAAPAPVAPQQGTPPFIAPGDQPGAAPPLPAMPPPTQVGAAPGMMPMPQTGPDLDAWRKLMDSLQFGKQGQ